MNRTDFKKAPRNKKPSLTDEYHGPLKLKKNTVADYDLVGQMPKKLQRKYFSKLKKKSKKGFRKRIVISTDNGYLSIYARDLITYLKDYKFRLIARPVPVRIAECSSPILLRVGSSLTTKYVITEDAKCIYCNKDKEIYNELSYFFNR